MLFHGRRARDPRDPTAVDLNWPQMVSGNGLVDTANLGPIDGEVRRHTAECPGERYRNAAVQEAKRLLQIGLQAQTSREVVETDFCKFDADMLGEGTRFEPAGIFSRK